MPSILPPEDQVRLATQVKIMYKEACEEAEEIGRQLNEDSRKKAEAQVREYYGPKTTLWQRIKEFLNA